MPSLKCILWHVILSLYVKSKCMTQLHQVLINTLNDCAIQCNNCYSLSLKEKSIEMIKCIRTSRDCADICQFTASMLARESVHGHHLLRECAEICDACAQICQDNKNEQCQKCASVCHACAEACLQHLSISGLK